MYNTMRVNSRFIENPNSQKETNLTVCKRMLKKCIRI